MNAIDAVAVDDIRAVFAWQEAIDFPEKWRTLPLPAWEMAADDCILRYVFRNFRPGRNLEFGTGSARRAAMSEMRCEVGPSLPPVRAVKTANGLTCRTRTHGRCVHGRDGGDEPQLGPHGRERLIGRKYLNAGWGRRVCQIYSDKRTWDTATTGGFLIRVQRRRPRVRPRRHDTGWRSRWSARRMGMWPRIRHSPKSRAVASDADVVGIHFGEPQRSRDRSRGFYGFDQAGAVGSGGDPSLSTRIMSRRFRS